jgi:methionyl-tRNA formyltransferase
MKVLFIGKMDDPYSGIAAAFVKQHFKDPVIIFSRRGDQIPTELNDWEGDLLISYLCQWIIPQDLLESASMASINFHPGPPDYPGIGCTNFAMYNGEKEFGVTCHHMFSKADCGPIIAVNKFPIFETDTVFSLTQRCYVEILHLFIGLLTGILKGEKWPVSKEYWKRKAYTRKDLNRLCELTPGMSQDEIEKRIRATTYGDKKWAYMKEERALEANK